jgi:hypothetical protein
MLHDEERDRLAADQLCQHRPAKPRTIQESGWVEAGARVTAGLTPAGELGRVPFRVA